MALLLLRLCPLQAAKPPHQSNIQISGYLEKNIPPIVFMVNAFRECIYYHISSAVPADVVDKKRDRINTPDLCLIALCSIPCGLPSLRR
jgi:hypothetical protein